MTRITQKSVNLSSAPAQTPGGYAELELLIKHRVSIVYQIGLKYFGLCSRCKDNFSDHEAIRAGQVQLHWNACFRSANSSSAAEQSSHGAKLCENVSYGQTETLFMAPPRQDFKGQFFPEAQSRIVLRTYSAQSQHA